MSGHQEYFCKDCGLEWEALEYKGCPDCRDNPSGWSKDKPKGGAWWWMIDESTEAEIVWVTRDGVIRSPWEEARKVDDVDAWWLGPIAEPSFPLDQRNEPR